jgi:hypothetical protein
LTPTFFAAIEYGAGAGAVGRSSAPLPVAIVEQFLRLFEFGSTNQSSSQAKHVADFDQALTIELEIAFALLQVVYWLE